MHRVHSGPIRDVTHVPMTTPKVTEVRNKQCKNWPMFVDDWLTFNDYFELW